MRLAGLRAAVAVERRAVVLPDERDAVARVVVLRAAVARVPVLRATLPVRVREVVLRLRADAVVLVRPDADDRVLPVPVERVLPVPVERVLRLAVDERVPRAVVPPRFDADVRLPRPVVRDVVDLVLVLRLLLVDLAGMRFAPEKDALCFVAACRGAAGSHSGSDRGLKSDTADDFGFLPPKS